MNMLAIHCRSNATIRNHHHNPLLDWNHRLHAPRCQLVEQRFWLIIGAVWIGCKRLTLKLSKVLMVEEVEGPCMHSNQRLIPLYKCYDLRDIQLTLAATLATGPRYTSVFFAAFGIFSATKHPPLGRQHLGFQHRMRRRNRNPRTRRTMQALTRG